MKLSIVVSLFLGMFFTTDLITLEDLKWKKRVVLFFPVQEDPFDWYLSDSLKIEIEERDLVYFIFSDSLISNTDYSFSEPYMKELKARYLLGSKAQCWVLLDKDGGLKLRKEEEELDWDELFTTIDDLPIRQREIKKVDR